MARYLTQYNYAESPSIYQFVSQSHNGMNGSNNVRQHWSVDSLPMTQAISEAKTVILLSWTGTD